MAGRAISWFVEGQIEIGPTPGSEFGIRAHPITGEIRPHNGIDIPGDKIPLFSPGTGKIIKAVPWFDGNNAGEYITIEFDQEFKDFFEISKVSFFHLSPDSLSTLKLEAENIIRAGQLIGWSGDTGRATGPHIHLEVFDLSGNPINPREYFKTYFIHIDSLGPAPQSDTEIIIKNNALQNDAFLGATDTNYKIYYGELRYDPDDADTENNNNNVKNSPPPLPPNYVSYKTQNTVTFDNNKINKIEDEEVKMSLIPIFMSKIIEKNRTVQGDYKYKNFIGINGEENTAVLQNIILGKDFGGDGGDYIDFENIDLSLMTPYAELYSIQINFKEGKEEFIEIPFEFDNYTNKFKLDSIFYDKTGRGGNIGLKSVEWKSLATNMSNQNFIEATVKIIIQDIQDISQIRNNISLLNFLYPAGTLNPEFNPKSFSVKMKAGWKFDPEKSNIFSDYGVNDPRRTDDYKNKIEQQLSQTFYLTLTNHRFEFSEDGSVELKIDYKGMLETFLDNQEEFNILDELAPDKKRIEKTIQFWEKFLDIFEDGISEQAFLNRIFRLVNDKSNLGVFGARIDLQPVWNASRILEPEFAVFYPYALRSNRIFNIDPNLNPGLAGPVTIMPEQFSDIRNFKVPFVLPEGTSFKIKDYWNIKIIFNLDRNDEYDESSMSLYWKLWKQAWFGGSPPPDTLEVSITNKAQGDRKFKDQIEKKIKEQKENLEKSYTKALTLLLKNISIDYFSITDKQKESIKQISTVSKNLYPGQFDNLKTQIDNLLKGVQIKNLDQSQSNNFWSGVPAFKKIENNKIEEAVKKELKKPQDRDFVETVFVDSLDMHISYTTLGDLLQYYIHLFYGQKDQLPLNFKLALGSFSYNDFGTFEEQKIISAIGSSVAPYGSSLNVSKEVKQRYANLAEIPVSIDSIIAWYNANIIDTNLKKMSFLEFIRKLFIDLINTNLKNNILSFAPQRTIIPSFSFNVFNDDDLSLDNYEGTFKTDLEFSQSSFTENDKRLSKIFKNYVTFSKIKLFSKINSFYKIRKNENKDNLASKKQNILFIFSKNEKDRNLKSDYKSDLERSIPHFYVGQTKGLIKSIKFSRQDNQKLESANILSANNNQSENMIIRQIYNVNIEMFGNTLLLPGQLIHVTPSFPGTRLDNPLLYQIGLGGYYIINEVSSTIEENEFLTKITGQWQMYGGGYEQITGKGFIIKQPD